MDVKILQPTTEADRRIEIAPGTHQLLLDVITQPRTERTRTEIVVREGAEAIIVCALTGAYDGPFTEDRIVHVDAHARATLLYWYRGGSNVQHSVLTRVSDGAVCEQYILGVRTGASRLQLSCEQQVAGTGSSSTSHERYLLLDASLAQVHGLVSAALGTRDASAHMDMRGILVGESARCDLIPELRIASDDVRAGHAASVSTIDAEQLFYLRSRGLDEATARSLIVDGVVRAFAEKIPDGAARRVILEDARAFLHE